MDSDATTSATVVMRSLRPGAPGTQKLRLQHGRNLICVRYRESMDGTVRLTTVELVVERRMAPTCPVQLAVAASERRLQAELRAAGARWDGALGCWITTLRMARQLKLQHRILGPHRTAPHRTAARRAANCAASRTGYDRNVDSHI